MHQISSMPINTNFLIVFSYVLQHKHSFKRLTTTLIARSSSQFWTTTKLPHNFVQ